MKEIIVSTQAELDALPESFEEFTHIVIMNTNGIRLSVVARGNSSVEAWENSSVVARGNSSVEAWENSSVVAWENSSVVARGNSSVVARGNSSVVAWENSSVEAWENSSVEAWENSSVVAWGNSSVVAWENSSVEAWENSSVVAWENVLARLFSPSAKLVLHGFAVAFVAATLSNPKLEKKSATAHIQIVSECGWFDRHGIEKTEKIIVYKRVSSDFKTQERKKNETLWALGSTVTIKKWNPARQECGEGKFHACSRPYFCDEFRSEKGDRYIAIEVAREDFHEWTDNPEYPHKIGFRSGVVLHECNRFGKKIA